MQNSQNPQFSTQLPPNFSQYHPNSFPNPAFNPYMMQQFNPYMMQPFNPSMSTGPFSRPISPRPSPVGVDDDDDVVFVPRQEVPHQQTGRQAWSMEEDEALISSYMSISTDSITGTYQKEGAFWGKVLYGYKTSRESNPLLKARNVEAVRCRWKRICSNVTKWVACMEEAGKMISSGMNDLDQETVAQRLWKKDAKEKFTMHQQYRMLRNYPRWEHILSDPDIPGNLSRSDSASGEKRSREDENMSFNLNSPAMGIHSPTESVQVSSSAVRPSGVKKSKNKGKGKGKGKVDENVIAAAHAMAEDQTKLLQLRSINCDKEQRSFELQLMTMLMQNKDRDEYEQQYLRKLLKKYGKED